MPEKLDRCVNDVKNQGKSSDSAWAICNASTGESKVQEKVNANRQVPYFNPKISKGKIEPDIKKKLTGSGEHRLNTDSVLWKDIFDAQLRQNVKESKA